MTKLEAINDLKLHNCTEKCHYHRAYGGCVEDCSVRMAIKELDRKIPKPPKKNGYYTEWFRKIYTYTCPTCGNILLTKKMNDRQDTSYCWDCGQRIDWEKVEL